MPVAEAKTESPPEPSQTATEDKGGASPRRAVEAKRVDPQQVAEQVYELMKQEIILGRTRGETH